MEAEPGAKKISRRELLRKAAGVGSGVLIAGGLGAAANQIINNWMSGGNNDGTVQNRGEGPRLATPQGTPLGDNGSVQNRGEGPRLATPQGTPLVDNGSSQVIVSQATPTLAEAAGLSTPNPADPTETPESTPTPVLTPEQRVEQGLPYKFSSETISKKEDGTLNFLSQIVLGADEGWQSLPNPRVSGFSFNEKMKNPQIRLEDAILLSYKNALHTQNPTTYGNLTVDQLKSLIRKGTAPKLILPKTMKEDNFKLYDNVPVDLVNKPIYFSATSGMDGAYLSFGVDGWWGYRVIDESLIIELYWPNAFGNNQNDANIVFNSALETSLLTLPDYEFQKDPAKYVKGKDPFNRLIWEEANFDGQQMNNLTAQQIGSNSWEFIINVRQ